MWLFNKIRKNHYNWEPGNEELQKREAERLCKAPVYAKFYKLPLPVVIEIVKFRKHDCPYDELDDPMDYDAMLTGASIAYKLSNTVCTFIDRNDPRAKEVTQFLCKKRIRFETNPIYGLSMVNDQNLRTEYELKYFPEHTNTKITENLGGC